MFNSILDFLLAAGGVILLFGGTVLVHELGHFLTAKWFGLRIDAFSIGMGPAIWKKEVNGVVYKIAWLPIGGYVALPQMDITGSAFENEDAKTGKLQPVDPWKRIVISLAGPFMNVVAALVLAAIVWGVGKQPNEGTQPPVVGWVAQKVPAYEAGLREGDRVIEVNGDKVGFWADVQISAMLNKQLDLKIVREDQIDYVYDVPTSVDGLGYLYLAGVEPAMPEVTDVLARRVVVGSPAEKAGIRPGDELAAVNGREVADMSDFREAVQAAKDGPVDITVVHAKSGEREELTLTPEWDGEHKSWLIGVTMMHRYLDVHPTPVEQIRYFSGSIFRTLKAFLRPKEAGRAAQGVGGPVMILTGMHAQISESVIEGLWFTALININLAIINLLPLIILDGGHIMVALFEWITGKKPHRGVITGMANVMVVILLTLMVLLVFKDVNLLRRIYGDAEPPPAAEQTATPEPPSPADDAP